MELLARALDPVACSHPICGCIYRSHTRLVVELLPLEPSQASGDVCLVLAACVCVLFCLLEDAFERLLYAFAVRAFSSSLRSKKQPEKSFLGKRYIPLACWNIFQLVDKRHLLKKSPLLFEFLSKMPSLFPLDAVRLASFRSICAVALWVGMDRFIEGHRGLGRCWLFLFSIWRARKSSTGWRCTVSSIGWTLFLHHCNWSQIATGHHNQNWDIVSTLLIRNVMDFQCANHTLLVPLWLV